MKRLILVALAAGLLSGSLGCAVGHCLYGLTPCAYANPEHCNPCACPSPCAESCSPCAEPGCAAPCAGACEPCAAPCAGPCEPCGPPCGVGCGPCGGPECYGGCEPPGILSGVLRVLHLGPGCRGCGPRYWGDFYSDPPDYCDPCDQCGNFTGMHVEGCMGGCGGGCATAGCADCGGGYEGGGVAAPCNCASASGPAVGQVASRGNTAMARQTRTTASRATTPRVARTVSPQQMPIEETTAPVAPAPIPVPRVARQSRGAFPATTSQTLRDQTQTAQPHAAVTR